MAQDEFEGLDAVIWRHQDLNSVVWVRPCSVSNS